MRQLVSPGERGALLESLRHDLAPPRISIVTPSFNQAQFLERTIRSVVDQGYANLEFIVVDGGSTDGSVEIIKKNARYMAYWVSEPDEGQAHAINKGFARATGEILGWLNSDDVLSPFALEVVAREFGSGFSDWVSGGCDFIDAGGEIQRRRMPDVGAGTIGWLTGENQLWQPSTFWSRRMWDKCGPLDESMHYSFDCNFFAGAAIRGFEPKLCAETLAAYRLHPDSKTARHAARFAVENKWITKRFVKLLSQAERRALVASRRRLRAQQRRERALFLARRAAEMAARRWVSRGTRYLVASVVRDPTVIGQRMWWGAARRLFHTGS